MVEEVNILAWRGFYSSRQAKKLLSIILDSYQDVAEENIPSWVNLTFHSFDEICSGISVVLCTVVTWNLKKKN